MKKTLMVFAALMTAFLMISCQNETTSENNTEEKKDTTAEKVAIYNNLVGTSWENEFKGKDNIYGKAFVQTVSFSDDAITINEEKYSINKYTDLFFYSDFSTDDIEKFNIRKGESTHFIVCLNGVYYTFSDELFAIGNYREEVEVMYPSSSYSNGWMRVFLKLVSSSDDSAGDSSVVASSVNGTYSYTATGTAQSGSLTLKDGTWSYSGDKTALSVKSGTYTVSGSKITVYWSTQGYDNTETFTISNSGSESTWTSENDSVSLFFTTIFTTAATTLTFTKS